DVKNPYVQEYKVLKGKLKGVFSNLKPDEIEIEDSALYFLASTAGLDQLAVYKELMAGIVTAQDLIAALASHHTRVSNDSVEGVLTRERIKQEFELLEAEVREYERRIMQQ
ncbi:hypothetical protein OSTOST_07541, partial [Ostertagia ostertagi]